MSRRNGLWLLGAGAAVLGLGALLLALRAPAGGPRTSAAPALEARARSADEGAPPGEPETRRAVAEAKAASFQRAADLLAEEAEELRAAGASGAVVEELEAKQRHFEQRAKREPQGAAR